MIEKKSEKLFLANAIPAKDGSIIRTSLPFKTGTFAGVSKRYITVELYSVRETLMVNGRRVTKGGGQAQRIVLNIWEHSHAMDFKIIVDESLVESAKAGTIDYIVESNQYIAKDATKQVELNWAPEGAFYKLTTPVPYLDANGVSRTTVTFFLLACQQDDSGALMRAFENALKAVGIDPNVGISDNGTDNGDHLTVQD